MRDYKLTDLPIVSWNIHGLFSNHGRFRYCKLELPYFMKSINNAKIFFLIETNQTLSVIDQIQLNGYKCFHWRFTVISMP